jgi:protein-glucosylgalactosylhydroxylysine glucosidase
VAMTSPTNPISPPPVTDWQADYLPAYLSNGLLGLRVGHIPPLYGVAMVSGFEGLDPITGVEAFARAPYPLSGDVCVGSIALSDPLRAVLREQRYDFSCGELFTTVLLNADDARIEIDLITLCSRTQPGLALQETRVRADRDCDLAITAGLDAQGVPGYWAGGGPFLWHSPGDLSTCGIAYDTEFFGADRFERSHSRRGVGPVITRYSFRASPGREYVVREYSSLVPEAMHSQPHMQAARLVDAGRLRSFDALREDNRKAWRDLWRGRVVLAGASTRWQALADAAYFYLQTSVHSASPSATSVFGLAYWPSYHYYRGHLMWDVETFAVPPLLLTHPEAALGLLRYRGARLGAAYANATLNGYGGAQYPWESSLQHGHEATPIEGKAPATELHVSMDVALAFARYVHVTNDLQFARNEAWPVLTAVAEWVESRTEQTPRGYEIHNVTGIAETGTTVDNDAFTNMAAALALRETVGLGNRLGLPYREHWAELAERIVIPVDPSTGIIGNHDGYRPDEYKGATPGAAAGLFPLGYPVDPETERNTLRFYVSLADRYAGAPMLSALLGAYASRVGDRAAALDLFEQGYGDFVIEPYTITAEYSPSRFPNQPRAGPFTANIGGFLTSCLYGLTGLRLHQGAPECWCERPIVLPAGWDAVEVERIWVRGRPVSIHAEHGATQAILR